MGIQSIHEFRSTFFLLSFFLSSVTKRDILYSIDYLRGENLVSSSPFSLFFGPLLLRQGAKRD